MSAGGEVSAGALVSTLEAAWRDIQAQHTGLPSVVIVVGPVSKAGKLSKWGHYAGLRWEADGEARAEVLISAEGLVRGARLVFETLLHESVHAWQDANDEEGTSRQGRYHNRTFTKRATEFGLVCEKDARIGCTTPDVSDATASLYAAAIERIGVALRMTRKLELAGAASTSRNGLVLVCGCDRKIRVTESVAEQGSITCGVCDREFLLEGEAA